MWLRGPPHHRAHNLATETRPNAFLGDYMEGVNSHGTLTDTQIADFGFPLLPERAQAFSSFLPQVYKLRACSVNRTSSPPWRGELVSDKIEATMRARTAIRSDPKASFCLTETVS